MWVKVFVKRCIASVTFRSILLLIVLACITHWRWIFLNQHFSSGDTIEFSWFIANCRDVFAIPSIWAINGTVSGFGWLNIVLSSYPSLNFAYAGLCTLSQSTILASKLVYLIPIPILAIIGSFLLTYSLLKNRTAGIIGAIVYSYNVPFLILQTGTIQWAVSYAFAPLIIYFFIECIDKKKIRAGIFAGLLSFMAGSYDFRILYIVIWVLLFYGGYQILFKIKNKQYMQIIPILLHGMIPFILILLLNFFWILPFYFSNLISSNAVFNRSLFGSSFFNLPEALTLFHPYWTGSAPSVFMLQPIPLYFWLIPIFALLGLLTNIKNKKNLFFTFIAVLGIMLTKQEDHPFSHLYLWLYTHFPGFNAYREASKFYILIALGYSILIGAFVKFMTNLKKRDILFSYFRTFLLVVIAGIFIWNTKPIITGEVGRFFIPVTLPNDYKILANILQNDHQFSRTLWFPAYSKWSYFDNTHPRFTIYYDAYQWFLEFQKNSAYVMHTYHTVKVAPDLPWNFEVLNQSFSGNFLDITSTKYIIIPPQYKNIPDDDMFAGTSINDRPFIINFFNHSTYMKKINIGTKDMVVYENMHYKPLIYTTSTMETVYKTIPYSPVQYQFINAAQYKVEIKNMHKPTYLNFNNMYDKGWVLDLGNRQYLSDKDHLSTDMQLNTFYINPTEIIKNYDKKLYTKNVDGSINLKARIFYKPQDLVNTGGYVSLVTLLSVFIFLIIDFFRNRDTVLKQAKSKRKKR